MVIVVCLFSYCVVLLEISDVKIQDVLVSFNSLVTFIYCIYTSHNICILLDWICENLGDLFILYSQSLGRFPKKSRRARWQVYKMQYYICYCDYARDDMG